MNRRKKTGKRDVARRGPSRRRSIDLTLTKAVGFFRRLVKMVPRDPIDFRASQEMVSARYARLHKEHDSFALQLREHWSEFQRVQALILEYVPDAMLPPSCGTFTPGDAVVCDPITNFSGCFDFCDPCRFEANRVLDLVESGLRTGRQTKQFVPPAVAQARIESVIERKRRHEASRRSSDEAAQRAIGVATRERKNQPPLVGERSLQEILAAAFENDESVRIKEFLRTIHDAAKDRPSSESFVRNALKKAGVKPISRGRYPKKAAINAYLQAARVTRSTREDSIRSHK